MVQQQQQKFDAWKETKELTGLVYLKMIAEQQEAQTKSMQQHGAVLQQQAAAFAAEANARAAEANARAAAEEERQRVEQQERQKVAAREKLRKNLFIFEDQLRTLTASEPSHDLSPYFWGRIVQQGLRDIPSQLLTEYEDMQAKARVSKGIQSLMARLEKNDPEGTRKVTQLVECWRRLRLNAMTLDKFQCYKELAPKLLLATLASTEFQKYKADLPKLQAEAAKGKKARVWLVVIAVMGAVALFGTIVGEPSENTTRGEGILACLMFLMVGGIGYYIAKRRKLQRDARVTSTEQKIEQLRTIGLKHIEEMQNIEESPFCNLLNRLQVPMLQAEPGKYQIAEQTKQLIATLEAAKRLSQDLVSGAGEFGFVSVLADFDPKQAEKLIKERIYAKVECPHCKRKMAIPPAQFNKTGPCPSCKGPMEYAKLNTDVKID